MFLKAKDPQSELLTVCSLLFRLITKNSEWNTNVCSSTSFCPRNVSAGRIQELLFKGLFKPKSWINEATKLVQPNSTFAVRPLNCLAYQKRKRVLITWLVFLRLYLPRSFHYPQYHRWAIELKNDVVGLIVITHIYFDQIFSLGNEAGIRTFLWQESDSILVAVSARGSPPA